MNVTTTSGAKAVSVEATVIRADGSCEPHGAVAYWHRNPLKRLLWRVTGRAF